MNKGIGAPVTKDSNHSTTTNIATEKKPKNPILYKVREHAGCFSPAKLEDHETEVKLSHKLFIHAHIYRWGFGGIVFSNSFFFFFSWLLRFFFNFKELYLAEQLPDFSSETWTPEHLASNSKVKMPWLHLLRNSYNTSIISSWRPTLHTCKVCSNFFQILPSFWPFWWDTLLITTTLSLLNFLSMLSHLSSLLLGAEFSALVFWEK